MGGEKDVVPMVRGGRIMTSVQTFDWMKVIRAAWASSIGGMKHALVEQPICTPVEAAITQTQVNGLSFSKNFGDLFRKRALYRSLPTALVGAMPKAMVHYVWLNLYLHILVPDADFKKATPMQGVMLGFLTGGSEVFLVSPINFVKFRMQRPEWGYPSMLKALSTIYRTEGLSAFWKGTGAVFCRNSVCMCGMLGGNKWILPRLPSYIPFRNVVAGAAGGLMGSFVSYPFEMLRAARQHNFSFKEEIISKGPRRLLAGWLPGACRLVITSAIMGAILPELNRRRAEAQATKRQ